MHLTVHRFMKDADSTVSMVTLDGKTLCVGLEDQHQNVKVSGETRIPNGTYQINVRKFGGFHNRYSAKFPNMHRGMLEIMDVPGFTDVLIHIGNTHTDSAGCLLVGSGVNLTPNLSITSSKKAYERLYRAAIDAAIVGRLGITFVGDGYEMV